jgi:hypothetical protein
MSSGAIPGPPAEITSQFAALNLNGPNGARPRPSDYSTIVEVGSHQTRGQINNKKTADYLGVSLIRLRRPNPTWKFAERRELPFSSEELAERDKKRKVAVTKIYNSLLPNMRGQVDALVEDENRRNPDKAYVWVLVAIKTKLARSGRIDVILRKDPNPRAVPKSNGPYSGMAGNPNAGGYPSIAQERGPIDPDSRSQGFQGRPPIPSPMLPPQPPPPPQQPQQPKQGMPLQKQSPAESFGGGILGNGNQFPPAAPPPPPPPPPPPMMPPGPPPPPQPQQKAGQNMPFNPFNQGPPMPQPHPPQRIPQQRNQQQGPLPPPQGGQNIPPSQPRQQPIVEQYGQQNHCRGFPHQSHPQVGGSSQRRVDTVSPWLYRDGTDMYEGEYSSDETEFTLSSTDPSDCTYGGSSPSRSNSMKMGKYPERGFDKRSDVYLAKNGPRDPVTAPYRHHRRESIDLDRRSPDGLRDGQRRHHQSHRCSYDDENIRPNLSRGRDLIAVGPYSDDDVEVVGRSRRAHEGYRRPSREHSVHYPRRRHTMHCHHQGCDDGYCVSASPRSRPTTVYGPRRTSEYLPYSNYSGHGFYDPRVR